MIVRIALAGMALFIVAAAGPIAPLLIPSLVPADLRRSRAAASPTTDDPIAGDQRNNRRRIVPWLVGVAALCLALLPAIRAGLGTRGSGSPITGDLPSTAPLPTTAPQTLQAAQSLVAASPDDTQARLDLARLEFSRGSLAAAADQYLAILQLDPSNAEARARLGFVLAASGHTKAGLDAIDQAMKEDPSYDEGLFLRGVVLMRFLNEPSAADRALHSFLADRPGGSEARAAKKLLRSGG